MSFEGPGSRLLFWRQHAHRVTLSHEMLNACLLRGWRHTSDCGGLLHKSTILLAVRGLAPILHAKGPARQEVCFMQRTAKLCKWPRSRFTLIMHSAREATRSNHIMFCLPSEYVVSVGQMPCLRRKAEFWDSLPSEILRAHFLKRQWNHKQHAACHADTS